MKAKEYFKRLKEADDRKKMFIKNAEDFALEFSDMSHKRKISTNTGIKTLYNEFHKKWCVYALMVNTKLYPFDEPVRYEGFKNMIKIISPELDILLKN
jgi:hypothetical protein